MRSIAWGLAAWLVASAVAAAQPLDGTAPVPYDPARLTLRQAEALLDRRNMELQLARVAVQSAYADTMVAAQPPNPALSVSAASIKAGDGIGAGPPWDKRADTVIQFEQYVERGNKRELRSAAARFTARAVEQDLAETRRRQRLLLYSSYYDLLLAQQKERISLEAVALCEKSMAEIGAAQGPEAADYVRLNVDRLKALNDARQARAERELAQAALAYLLAIEQDSASLRAADSWPAVREPAAGPRLDGLLARRHDYNAAAMRLQAALQDRELARAQRVRDVTVAVQLQRYPSVDGTSVGIGVSFPLFTRHHYEGEIGRAAAGAEAAQLAVQRTRALIATELAQSRAELQSAAERAKRYDRVLIREAERAGAAAEQAYSAGELGVMDLLDARRNLYATRVDAAVAHRDYAKARAAWDGAILAPSVQ